jgi:hypothetical protein
VAKAALAVVAAALLVAPATASADASPAQAIAALNAQRSANGIPAGIVEDTQRSTDCANHNAYEQQNDGLQHGEDKGKPGYTDGGNEASLNAVLAQGSSWGDGSNPWETAPIHLMQLLSPRLKSSGVADAGGWVCMTTWLGIDDNNGPAANVVYTYPGDGATNWRGGEVASESPFTPGDKVGLPQPTRTGPYIYALLDGPGNLFNLRSEAHLTSATLTGPNGAVGLKTLDSTDSELGPYMVPGAYIIPAAPLATGKYTGSVTFTVGGVPVTKTWSFTVGGGSGPGPATLTTKTSLPSTVKGSTLSGSITCSAACSLTLTLTAKGFKKALAKKTYTAKSGGKVKIKLKLPSSAKGKVKKATLKISAKNLAGGSSPKSSSKTIKFK